MFVDNVLAVGYTDREAADFKNSRLLNYRT